jgi:hypothetical protein
MLSSHMSSKPVKPGAAKFVSSGDLIALFTELLQIAI